MSKLGTRKLRASKGRRSVLMARAFEGKVSSGRRRKNRIWSASASEEAGR